MTTTNLSALADVHMMTVTSDGRARSRGDFARLLDGAGLRWERIFAGAMIAAIEARAV